MRSTLPIRMPPEPRNGCTQQLADNSVERAITACATPISLPGRVSLKYNRAVWQHAAQRQPHLDDIDAGVWTSCHTASQDVHR
jgi:hypothetical protein